MKKIVWVLVITLLVLCSVAAQVPEDPSDLPAFLSWLIYAGGASLFAYWIIERLPTEGMTEANTRMLAFLIAGIIGLGAQGIRYGLGHIDLPVGLAGWTEELWSIFMTAGGGATLFHGLFQLRGKPRIPQD